ncbi:MAG: site-2 protease family protein [Chryseolinea sp.]
MTRESRTLLIQAALFITTLITTTLAGAEWTYGKSIFIPGYEWSDFVSGFAFSIPFLLILTTHELGHYFTARYHSVSATLPFYIPIPPLPFSIGTMGALIRLRQKVYSKRQNFDIGISGPLAGFVMALIVLVYGFVNLPEPSYIFQIHPEYEEYGLNYKDHVYDTNSDKVIDVIVGQNLLFLFFEKFVADHERMPNPHELMHYPLLFAGFLSLVFTSLNLLPIGQLDGGHVVYGLFGSKIHRVIATVAFIILLYYAGIGLIDLHDTPENLVYWIGGGVLFLYMALQGLGLRRKDTIMYAVLILASLLLLGAIFPNTHGFSGWVVFVFLLGRFIGIQHPPSEIEEPLDTKRIILGWIALIIFVVSFSPSPIQIGE